MIGDNETEARRAEISYNRPMTDAPLHDIDAATAKAWLDSRNAVMVDVRETSEFEFENVPGSVLLPLSFLDPDTFPPITDKKVIIVCAIGKRGEAARKQLADAGLPNIHNLLGGLDAWKKAGLPTQGGKYEAIDYTI